jgi:ribosomal protein S18 acetylase RimI-like enzyme
MRKTTIDLILRPRRPSDDDFIYRLSERVFAAYSLHPTGSMASMLGEAGARSVVAEQAGSPVGFYVVGFERLGRPFGPWQRPALARLNAIGVLPALHGRGIGGLLLASAEEVARDDEGAVSMTLMTAETNTRARRLFSSAGYSRLFVLDHAYARGQRGIVMTKAL